jgi:hypothetical protein
VDQLTVSDKVVLISSGNDATRLTRLEQRFGAWFPAPEQFHTLRLGVVESLAQAYHQAVVSIPFIDAILIFAHQDVFPLLLPDSPVPQELLASTETPDWLKNSLQVHNWLETAMQLLSLETTGFIGVAGSVSMATDKAWWETKKLSGVIFHFREDRLKLNPYGPFGSVAALDGVCLITTLKKYRKLALPQITSFHHYDSELCLRSIIAGFTNWTIPLLLVHESGGAKKVEEKYQKDSLEFTKKYSQYLPLEISFQPLPDAVTQTDLNGVK